MSKIKELWLSTRKYIFIAAATVLIYFAVKERASVFATVSRLFSILGPVFAAIAIAFIANMPMRFLENRVFARWQHNKSAKRAVCMLLGLLFILAILAVLTVLILPRLTDSIRQLVENFDGYVASLSAWGTDIWERLNLSDDTLERINTAVQSLLSQLDDLIVDAAAGALKVTANLAAGVVKGLIAVILSVYLLFNKEKLLMQFTQLFRAILSPKHAESLLSLCTRTNRVMNKYILGMITECSILGVMCFIGMRIFGFPYALLISVMVGVTQMAPIIGPWSATIIAALIIFIVDPSKALWFVLMEIIIQQLEEQIFYPRVVGSAVGLSGMWVIIAVLLGGGLFGIGGVVLAVPIMAVLYTLVSEWVERRTAERNKQAELANLGDGDGGE